MQDALFWTAFCAIALPLTIGAVRLYHETVLDLDVRGAALWSAFWVLAALLFGLVLAVVQGTQVGSAYLLGYTAEKALAIDNVFIFTVVFAMLRIPPRGQYHVLLFGLIGAVVLRGVVISAGAALAAQLAVFRYLGGALLLATSFALTAQPVLGPEMRQPALLRWLLARLRVVECADDHALMVRIEGRRRPTRLMIALCILLFTDLVFAAASLPAILAADGGRLVVFTANAFAVLGMKALYTLLTHLAWRFSQLKTGLSMILVFVGVKLMLPFKLGAGPSVAAVGLLLAGTEASAMVAARRRRGEPVSRD